MPMPDSDRVEGDDIRQEVRPIDLAAALRDCLAAQDVSETFGEASEPSDRDLLRAMAITHLDADRLVDAEHDVDDLFAAALIELHRDCCDEYQTGLTDRGRDLIRAAINREET